MNHYESIITMYTIYYNMTIIKLALNVASKHKFFRSVADEKEFVTKRNLF